MNKNEYVSSLMHTIESGLDFADSNILRKTEKTVLLVVVREMNYLASVVGNKEIEERSYVHRYLKSFEELETFNGLWDAKKQLRADYGVLLDEFINGGN